MIIAAVGVIVNLKVTQVATCGSLASAASDSESDDDACLGPPVGSGGSSKSMIGCKIKPIPNTDIVYLHEISSINTLTAFSSKAVTVHSRKKWTAFTNIHTSNDIDKMQYGHHERSFLVVCRSCVYVPVSTRVDVAVFSK